MNRILRLLTFVLIMLLLFSACQQATPTETEQEVPLSSEPTATSEPMPIEPTATSEPMPIEPTATPESKPVEIKVIAHSVHESAVTGGAGAEIDVSQQLLKDTGISIVWDTQPWPDILERTVRELALSQSDVSFVFLLSQQYSPLVRNQLMPLNEFQESEPIENFEGIAPGLLDYVTDSNGNIYGIPMRAYGNVLFYNKEILAKHGITEPPTTWEEYIQYAKEVTGPREDGANIYGLRFEPSYPILAARAYGGDVLSPDYEILFTEEPFVRALNEAIELYNEGVFPPDFMNLVADDWLTLEQNGQVTFDVRGPTYYSNLNDPEVSMVAGMIGVTDVPASSEIDRKIVPTNSSFWSMSIPKNSANPEAAWKVIRYLSSLEGATMMALNGNAPTRLEVYDNPEFVAQNPEWAEASRRALEIAKPNWPAFDEQARAEDILTEQFVLAITGQKTPEEALNDAATLIKPLLP